MNSALLSVLVLVAILQSCTAPPVTKTKEKESEETGEPFELLMHYHRYLKQVVSTLESDPEFKKKLEAADEADIRTGKIANELEFVSHHVRTRLDEIKRHELDRLRSLTRQKQQLSENEVIEDPNHGHLDRSNPHTFEIEDLKKLIAKTTEDLAEADRKRREEFKQYELQKEYDKQDKLNNTDGTDREKLQKQYQELDEKHRKHEPLHQPGHKAQLEEVWEEQDHMQQEFDPKTFFMMHDLDSNGLWDQDEVKALFVKELDKLYAAGAPEDDLRERVEEMERMRETVFHEVDTNRDGFIDFREFVDQTKRQDFQQDRGWKGLDEQRPFTDEELQQYIHQQQMLHPPPGYHVPPGHYPPPGYHPQQGPQSGGYQNYHPNQVPPQQPQGYPQQQQQGGHPQQFQPQPGHPQQFQPQAGHPQQFQQPQAAHPQQFQQPQAAHPQQFQQPQAAQPQQFQQPQIAQPQQFKQQQQQQQQQPQPISNQVGQGPNSPPLNTNEVYPNQQQPVQGQQPQVQQQQPPPPPQQNFQQLNNRAQPAQQANNVPPQQQQQQPGQPIGNPNQQQQAHKPQ